MYNSIEVEVLKTLFPVPEEMNDIASAGQGILHDEPQVLIVLHQEQGPLGILLFFGLFVAHRFAFSFQRGSSSVNVLPFPQVLSTWTLPPWARAISAT